LKVFLFIIQGKQKIPPRFILGGILAAKIFIID